MIIPQAFWLTSYPKSGNTWARMFLGAYKNGVVNINNSGGETEYDCDRYMWNALSPVSVDKADGNATVLLRPAVLYHIAVKSKLRPLIIKTHNANIKTGSIELIPQELTASAVYLVRDPRDVCASFAKHTGNGVEMTIAFMSEMKSELHQDTESINSYLTSWSNHVTSWDLPGLVRLRYEDMKENPEQEFTRMLEGFGLEVDADRVKTAVELCDLEKLKKQEEEAGFNEKGKADKFFGQGKGWENELTEKQVRKIEIDHGEVMEQMGYKLEYL